MIQSTRHAFRFALKWLGVVACLPILERRENYREISLNGHWLSKPVFEITYAIKCIRQYLFLPSFIFGPYLQLKVMQFTKSNLYKSPPDKTSYISDTRDTLICVKFSQQFSSRLFPRHCQSLCVRSSKVFKWSYGIHLILSCTGWSFHRPIF